MTAQIMDGKAIAKAIRDELTAEVATFTEASSIRPCLAAVLVGDDPASQVYVRNKQRACKRAGIDSQLHRLPTNTDSKTLLHKVQDLNTDPAVHGILVQLPLPAGIDETLVLDAVDPMKDVDAFHPENVGLISQGRPRFLPCTPHGVQQLLHRCGIQVAGKHAVVIGRSDIVGKPMAMLLSARDSTCGPTAANATVTVAHSRTPDLSQVTREAEVLLLP